MGGTGQRVCSVGYTRQVRPRDLLWRAERIILTHAHTHTHTHTTEGRRKFLEASDGFVARTVVISQVYTCP